MPRVDFQELPGTARIWVFGSDQALTGRDAERLLALADEFLDQWAAHGVPLRCARDWRGDRFLVLGVDPSHEQASGCSIDGMFRALQAFQREVAARLLGGARVFYRGASGDVHVVSREEFETMAAAGRLAADTTIFDTSITSAADYRARFEVPATEAWTAAFFAGSE